MFFKFIKQILIYTSEIVLMSIMISWILYHCFGILHSLEYLERLLIGYSIYQIFVYITLKILDDITRDEAAAFLKFLKYVQLYHQQEDARIEKVIKDSAIELNSKSIFMNKKLKNEIKSIADNLDTTNIVNIRSRIIDNEHNILLLDLNWRLSFLLRLVK